MKEKLVVIVGPTAVGKTGLSVRLAKRVHGEIISGDSMQVYRGMDIGTAKIMPEEMEGFPIISLTFSRRIKISRFRNINSWHGKKSARSTGAGICPCWWGEPVCTSKRWSMII